MFLRYNIKPIYGRFKDGHDANTVFLLQIIASEGPKTSEQKAIKR